MAVESPVGEDHLRQVNPVTVSSSNSIVDFVMSVGGYRDEEEDLDPAAHVNQHTLLTVGPFFRAVTILSGLIGRLEITLQRKERNNRKLVQDQDNRNFLVQKKPNPFIKARTWKKQKQLHAMLTPGGFTEIIRNPVNKQILALNTLDPNNVLYGVFRDKAGYDRPVYFYYDNPNKDPRPIPFNDVIHVKGLSYNGVMGIDPVNLMRQDLGLAMARRTYAKTYFHSNGHIRGFMVIPPEMSAEKWLNFMETTKALMADRSKDPSKTIPLFGGGDFKPVSDTPDKSQLKESLELTPEMVSAWTGVPEMLLGRVKESSYNSLEQVMKGFFFGTLDDWLDEYEDELDDKLLTEQELREGKLCFRFNRSQLNAMLIDEFHKMIRENFASGLGSWEESREAMDLPTDPEDGHFYLPQNLVGANPINPGTQQVSSGKSKENGTKNVALRNNAQHTISRICHRINKAISHAASKENLPKQLPGIAANEAKRSQKDLHLLNELSLGSGLIQFPIEFDLLGHYSQALAQTLSSSGDDLKTAVEAACQTATNSVLSEYVNRLLGIQELNDDCPED